MLYGCFEGFLSGLVESGLYEEIKLFEKMLGQIDHGLHLDHLNLWIGGYLSMYRNVHACAEIDVVIPISRKVLFHL